MLANEDIYVESTPPNLNVNPKIVGAYWINKNDGNCYVCKDNSFNKNVWIKVGDYDKQIEEIKAIINSKGGYSIPDTANYKYKKSLHTILREHGLNISQNTKWSSIDCAITLPDLGTNNLFMLCSHHFATSPINGLVNKWNTGGTVPYILNNVLSYIGEPFYQDTTFILPGSLILYNENNTQNMPRCHRNLITPGRYRLFFSNYTGTSYQSHHLPIGVLDHIFFIQ